MSKFFGTRLTILALVSILGWAGSAAAQDKSLQYYQAGNTFYGQKSYDQAIQYYQYATQLNPNLWQAYQGLGNCYYAKGDKATALTNYQKALAINPNNPSLTPFVQSLQAQVGAPATAASPAVSGGTATAAAAPSAGRFELGLNAGVAFSSLTGFGGGASGFYMLDKNFGIGGMANFYTFGQSASGSGYGVTVTASASTDFLEVLAGAKYKFDGANIRPYAFAGVGIADAIVSASASVGGASGSGSTSSIDPMFAFGGGVEFPAGKDLSIFVQGKYSIVIVPGTSETVSNGYGGTTTVTGGGGTSTYLPIEAGVLFDL